MEPRSAPAKRTPTPAQALAGLRVLELGSLVSASYAAKLLADLGADVVKVEDRLKTDTARRYGPFLSDRPDRDTSGAYQYLNANKRGVAIDLSTATGRNLLGELARGADLLIENFPPEQMERWRLDYASLEKINPSLVVTSITPFGWTGPYRGYLGNDLLAWHASGAGHHFLGDPGRAPLRPPFYHAEHWAAVCAAAASLIALEIKEAAGIGQHVDISVADVFVVLVMGYQLPTVFHDRGVTANRKGIEFRGHAPAGMLRCKDGYVFIMTLGENQWSGLRQAMGNPAWADEPLFDVPAWERVAYADEILAMMEGWLMSHTKDEIFRLCQANRVPATAVYDTSELVLQPHLAARDFWVDLPISAGQTARAPGAPYVFSETPWRLSQPAPKRGQHNAKVLQGNLGVSREQMARLWRAGVL